MKSLRGSEPSIAGAPGAGRSSAWFAPATIALVVAAGVAWLLHRSLFEAHAQTYDTMIYGRSLWGIAHGVTENSVLGVHWLAVHANYVLFALAPFTALCDPASVLIAAQALALFVTVALATREAARDQARPFLVALGFGFALTLGSPLVLNPFLFDARPDLIGVALCTVGLLRIRATRIVDGRAAAWLCAALLVREEFAFVVGPALVALPVSRASGLALRTRWIIALGAIAYAAVYTLYGRAFFGGAAAAERVASLTSAMLGAPTATTLPYQGEILAVSLFAAGGLALAGGRWSVPAWPGIAFLLAIVRRPEVTLNAHYALLSAPGLIVAAVEGAQRLRAWPADRRRIAWAAVLALSTTAWLVSSSAPGGRRFLARYFDLDAVSDKAERFEHTPFLVDAHALVERIPAGAPAAIPYAVAAASLERELLWDGIRLRRALAGSETFPDALRWVAVPATEYGDVGRSLVQLHGFRLVDEARGWMALLTREAVATDALVRLSLVAGGEGGAVVTRSTAVGLRIEGLKRGADGRVSAIVVREGAALGNALGRAVRIVLQGTQPVVELTAMNGMFNPRELPVGRALAVEGGPVPAHTTVVANVALPTDAGQWILAPVEKAESVVLE
jgi:uncharacterized membrane protein